MFDRRLFMLSLVAVPMLVAVNASAGTKRDFTEDAFAQALASGKPLIIAVHADWCPTCSAQKPILERLLTEKFADMTEFTVDFDHQKDVVRRFDARMQSTLIVFKGGKEVGRSVGDTNAASIEALLRRAA